MTIGYFPKLYPDELLCSAVARYRVHTMATANAQVARELYNSSHKYTSIAIPHNLNLIHKQIGQFIDMSPSELAYRATLFPYYFAFQSKEIRDHMLNTMLHEQRHAIVNSGWNPRVKRVKICPECMQEDLANFGEAYWHRTHQLDCVHFCEKHTCQLLEAVAPLSEGRPLEALTPYTPTKTYLPFLSETSKQRLFEMGRLAANYLYRETFTTKGRTINIIPREFREVYSLPGEKLDMTRTRRDFVEYFGEQCLEILGIPINAENSNGWFNLAFVTLRTCIPIKRIAFEVFYTNYIRRRSKQVRSAGYINNILANRAWRCQNPAADHFGKKVIMNVNISACFSKNDSITFKCSCGYVFHVKSSTWDRRTDPIPKRIHEYGTLFVEMVRTLSKDGESISAISRKLNVNYDTIKRMISPDYRTTKFETRSEVLDAISISGRLRKARRLALTTSKPGYESRDRELAQQICQAARLLLAQQPPVQVSTKRILETSGIAVETLIDEPYYPRALSALKHVYETAPDFYIRRRNYASSQKGNAISFSD